MSDKKDKKKAKYIVSIGEYGHCEEYNCEECLLAGVCGATDGNLEKRYRAAKKYLAEHTNQWKLLEVDNLPSDILTGGYEFEYKSPICGDGWLENDLSITMILTRLIDKTGIVFRYHKRPQVESTEPSHEEIMTNFWEGSTQYKGIKQIMWFKVLFYFPEKINKYGTVCIGSDNVTAEIVFTDKEWFTGRKSATIPTEATDEN